MRLPMPGISAYMRQGGIAQNKLWPLRQPRVMPQVPYAKACSTNLDNSILQPMQQSGQEDARYLSEQSYAQ